MQLLNSTPQVLLLPEGLLSASPANSPDNAAADADDKTDTDTTSSLRRCTPVDDE